MADDEAFDDEYHRYKAEIDCYEREFRSWVTRGKKILKLYKDADNPSGKNKRFNVLWSNVQTLKPALYARTPDPIAERRFKDTDPVGRTASEVLERCISYTLDCENFDQVMRQAVDDNLLPGRGVMFWRYEPEFNPVEGESEDSEELTYERARCDYVNWDDFGHNVGRTWDETWLVWRRVYMKRAELVDKFGEEVGNQIPLDWKLKNLKDEKIAETVNKACIYQCWDKEKGVIVSLSKGWPRIIKTDDDALNLTGMFPCSMPLYATLTNDSLVPTPDYALYQTQAQEIEDLTRRIGALKKALKVVGVYDTSAPELANLLNDGYENKLVPVDQWAAFAEKGGLKGAVDFLSVKEVAEVLISLYEAREQAKTDLYELIGLSDIIRGHSDPRETATAQQMKGDFAVLRISDRQQDVQRFARDNIRICAEIIAENFDIETIKQISGVKLLTQAEKEQIKMLQSVQGIQVPGAPPVQQQPIPPQKLELMSQPSWEDVYGLLQNQVLREFRIDIETDSTIRLDEDAERESRTEFLNAAGAYVKNAMEAVQVSPEMAPLMGELLMFGVRSFRAGRSMEPMFEDTLKKLQNAQQKPDPQMSKIQGELELKKQEMQLRVQGEQQVQQAQAEQETQRQQVEDQRAERDAQREFQLAQQKLANDKEIASHKAVVDANAKVRVAEIQSQLKQQEMQQAERHRNEDMQASEGQKAYDGERHKMRENMLSQAQKLVESLQQLRDRNLH